MEPRRRPFPVEPHGVVDAAGAFSHRRLTTPCGRVELPAMSSAKIINFPRAARRRPVSPMPARYAVRPQSPSRSCGFGLLFFLTFAAAFAYLSGAVNVARHDTLYTALLTTVWGFYLIHPPLLRIRVLGPLLARAGRLLLIAGVAGFFGFVYWIVVTHP